MRISGKSTWWLSLAQSMLLCLGHQQANGQEGAVSPDSTSSKTTTIQSQSSSSGPGATASQSTEVIIERQGVGGIRSSNVFRPKYKQRLTTYGEQIDLGITRGWLTSEEAARFKQEIARLAALEAEASAHGYPKPELDNLEGQFTKFNIDLSQASNKPAAGTTKSAPPVPSTSTKPIKTPPVPPVVPAPAPGNY